LRTRITARDGVESERELFEFAYRYLSEAFPNQERSACPTDNMLKSLVNEPIKVDRSINEHISWCSPCLAAYFAHLDREKARIRRERSYRVPWLRRAIIATITLLVVGIPAALIITKHYAEKHLPHAILGRASVGEKFPSNDTGTYIPVAIDLSNASPTRGSKGRTKPVQAIVPAVSKVDLTIRLPLGSEEQLYSLALLSGQKILWSGSEYAHRRDGDTVVRVLADFTHISAGTYDLQVAAAARRLTVSIAFRDFSLNRKPMP